MLLEVVVVSLQHFYATCAGCVERLLKTQPGVLNASVDCKARSLYIDYDSRIVSDERIAHLAHRFVPQLLTQSQHCSGRLNQSSCATCILHLDHRPPRVPGIRRATASAMLTGGHDRVAQAIAFALCVIVVLAASALGFHLPLPIGVVGHEGSTSVSERLAPLGVSGLTHVPI